ncbi:N-acetylmuramoyl-L-alanine amidase [bacterium]|nr:N-acetylmuramoyl-L-alanine amidase [bacterium]
MSDTHTLLFVRIPLFVLLLLIFTGNLYAQVDSDGPTASATATELIPLQVVVIDPGHGGRDAGIAQEGFLKEKDYVLQIALEVRKKLRHYSGIKVFLTRDRDMTMAILERVAFANKKEADVFISLHQIFTDSPGAGKSLRIYFNQTVADPELGRVRKKNIHAGTRVLPWDLGQNSQRVQSRRLGISVRKAWEEHYPAAIEDAQSDYPMSVSLAVLRGIHAPAIMVEVPFMQAEQADRNDDQTDRIVQKEIAKRITTGIMRFLANR